ncbi:hypothetical protein Dsin_012151 [Dipteronia sinensis]|uniref:Uncharacterized protein n=1 Tax=Dipteronia sinensis TaxID=43782 RepID=A0AAE0E7R6_9ROSI|nr:hypothetical protein Dsin_012151 [Dipteronia sinensis]
MLVATGRTVRQRYCGFNFSEIWIFFEGAVTDLVIRRRTSLDMLLSSSMFIDSLSIFFFIIVWTSRQPGDSKIINGTDQFLTDLEQEQDKQSTEIYVFSILLEGATANPVWDIETLRSVMTLDGHTDAVMSLLCWDQYLLSCSLDRTIKVWFATDDEGNLDVAYTHNEEHGVLQLHGLNDPDGKPVLLCACNDSSVHLYELPSFIERGRIFAKREVRAIQIGPDNIFFTGDGTGMLSVWKLLAKPSGEAS